MINRTEAYLKHRRTYKQIVAKNTDIKHWDSLTQKEKESYDR